MRLKLVFRERLGSAIFYKPLRICLSVCLSIYLGLSQFCLFTLFTLLLSYSLTRLLTYSLTLHLLTCLLAYLLTCLLAIYLTIIIIYNILISFVCAYMRTHARAHGKDSVKQDTKKGVPFLTLPLLA